MEKLPGSKLVDLQQASQGELEPLRVGLQKTNGTLQVLVHPFFRNDFETVFAGKFESPKAYQLKRDKFIADSLRSKHPLLVFEAYNEVDRLPERIQTPGTLFYVETRHLSPDPTGSMHQEEDGSYRSRPDLSWQKIGFTLKRLGTRKTAVGGLRLHFDSVNADLARYLSVYDPQNKSLPYEQFHNTVQDYADRIRSQTGRSSELAIDEFLKNRQLIAAGCVGGVLLGLLQQEIDAEFSPVRAAEYTDNVPVSARKY